MKKKSEPKPTGAVALKFRETYTPDERARMAEDQKAIEERIAKDRAIVARLKAQLRRKASVECVTVRCELETMKLFNDATGEPIHPTRLSSGQWAQVIAATKAAQ